MTVSGPRYGKCRYCKQRFKRADRPGRRQEYCDHRCRQRAQRERSRCAAGQEESRLPLGRNIAEAVQALAEGLLTAEYDERGLDVLLSRAGELAKEVEYYVCAAVHDARVKGTSWEAVAGAAAVSAATARGRWAEKTVERRLARRASERAAARQLDPAAHAPQLRAEDQEAVRSADRTAGKLAAALSHLHRLSRLTIREVAEQTGLSSSYVSRILSGDRLPGWPVVRTLADLFEGDPDDLAVLWENAQGMTPAPRQGLPDAAARLNAALRGLHLAAASPTYTGIHEASGGTLSVPVIRDILSGRLVPKWSTTVTFVRALGGTPADIRPVWEAVHYAFLFFLDPVPDDTQPPTEEHRTDQEREDRPDQDG